MAGYTAASKNWVEVEAIFLDFEKAFNNSAPILCPTLETSESGCQQPVVDAELYVPHALNVSNGK